MAKRYPPRSWGFAATIGQWSSLRPGSSVNVTVAIFDWISSTVASSTHPFSMVDVLVSAETLGLLTSVFYGFLVRGSKRVVETTLPLSLSLSLSPKNNRGRPLGSLVVEYRLSLSLSFFPIF